MIEDIRRNRIPIDLTDTRKTADFGAQGDNGLGSRGSSYG